VQVTAAASMQVSDAMATQARAALRAIRRFEIV
jgi:hypothetical protein